MRCASPVVLLCALVCGSADAAAQTVAPPSDPPDLLTLSLEQQRELDDWLAKMDKWRRQQIKYDNRPTRDRMGRIVPRREAPAAPAWLNAHCDALARTDAARLERTNTACALLEDPLADITRLQQQVVREQAEQPVKYSAFLRRLHFDGGWVTTSNGPRSYGIVGTHMTLVDVGRVQMFGPPGVMLLSVPDGAGRRVTLGYTWGVSVRLADVRVSSPASNLSLFLTFSKVWMNGDGGDSVSGGDTQIVGLSIAPRKNR
jgi:hypothetical protein